MESTGVKYNNNVIENFRPAVMFTNSEYEIIYIDISRWGKYLIAVNSQNILYYYNIETGSLIDVFRHNRVGVSIAKFSHNHFTIIWSSSPKIKHVMSRSYSWRLDVNSVAFAPYEHMGEISNISVWPSAPYYSVNDKSI